MNWFDAWGLVTQTVAAKLITFAVVLLIVWQMQKMKGPQI